MIRYSIALLALILCGVAAIQPGCRTRYELRMKWTVQDNYNRYWECARWGKAVQFTCPIGTRFSAPFQTCVPIKSWEEFPYYPPPTSATDATDECTETGVECIDRCTEVPCEGGIVIDGVCECDEPGWGTIDGVCTDPNVGCIGGVIQDDECKCEDGFHVVDGRCTVVICELEVPSTVTCTCPEGSSFNTESVCVCPDNSIAFNDTCVPCGGGELNGNGECVCPPDNSLVDGSCVAVPPEIDGCENGDWNEIENYCVCHEGFEMIEGKCVPTSNYGGCYNAPESAYAPGEWDCGVPECTEEEYQANFHFPTRNPRTFYQCEHDKPTEMPCAPMTCFSPEQQVCVHIRDWKNPCK